MQDPASARGARAVGLSGVSSIARVGGISGRDVAVAAEESGATLGLNLLLLNGFFVAGEERHVVP